MGTRRKMKLTLRALFKLASVTILPILIVGWMFWGLCHAIAVWSYHFMYTECGYWWWDRPCETEKGAADEK